jgi:Protein of unknown function (DUF2971)
MYGGYGQFAYHYTTSDAAFGHILPASRLRLSSLAKLRDPVENKDWVEQLWTGLSWPDEDVMRFDRLTKRPLTETKIVSFTLDAAASNDAPEHARGYARPRMWEQYADNHSGVCLVFERARLTELLMVHLGQFGQAISDEVVYSNKPRKGHVNARSVNASTLAHEGDGDIEVGLRRHIEVHAAELFFRKLEDWASEHEYRFLALDDEERVVYAPYGDALRAVIIGERFPDWQLAAAARACSIAQVDLRQILWGAFPPGVYTPSAAEV